MTEKLRNLANKVIRRMLTVLGFSSTFAFMACYAPAMSDEMLRIDPSTIEFDADGSDTVTVSVITPDEWSVTEQPDFVKVEPTNGRGSDVIKVISEANPTERAREGTLTVKVPAAADTLEAEHAEVVITQKGI